jgi:hypothetical protein
MDVMIGVDPHKGSHTATMLDRDERELRRIKVRANSRQVGELLEHADADVRGEVYGAVERGSAAPICSGRVESDRCYRSVAAAATTAATIGSHSKPGSRVTVTKSLTP